MTDICIHCGAATSSGKEFCCRGCAAAYAIINGMGLGGYYRTRSIEESPGLIKPDENVNDIDFSSFITTDENGIHSIYLMVEGIHCASCVWLIEAVLNKQDGVKARLNMSTRRLALNWSGDEQRGNELVKLIASLGYKMKPFDINILVNQDEKELGFLLKCLAVAGFASGNIMIFSFALWFTTRESMGGSTRDLIHWFSALIALPAIIYSGLPFYKSAWQALKSFRTNMDVPISLAIILAAAMSLFETVTHGEYVYFDSATMLLFFLLIGRFLDRRARGKARSTAQELLSTMSGSTTLIDGKKTKTIAAKQIKEGMLLLITAGEKIYADGVVEYGESEIDTSMITGETMPQKVKAGEKVFAGMINISAPLKIRVTAADSRTLLGEIVRIMENAEQKHARYVRLADRIAGLYTPVVHLLAAIAFLGWLYAGSPWQDALLISITVLIITCPCALALAVPAVQVLASGNLFRKGILLKSPDALERIREIDAVIFDKTGTLTVGRPELENVSNIPKELMKIAASMAAKSKHPLSRAVVSAYEGEVIDLDVVELAGNGLVASHDGKEVMLGKRDWCGNKTAPNDKKLELWLNVKGNNPVRFTFSDAIRKDSPAVVKKLKEDGFMVILLSGDRENVVSSVANEIGIEEYHSEMNPAEKCEYIKIFSEKGHKVLMVGDGLNDAPALALAHASISPSTAADISQNAADIVFQGKNLMPVIDVIKVARRSNKLVMQNLALSLLYNLIAIPFAMVGMVTPLFAAIAMSSSSIIVILNSLRLNMMKG